MLAYVATELAVADSQDDLALAVDDAQGIALGYFLSHQRKLREEPNTTHARIFLWCFLAVLH
jgi:hypothetical protein